MAKKSKKEPERKDVNALAFSIMRKATEEAGVAEVEQEPPAKNEAAAELGRRGAKRRAERLTPEQRTEAARLAAEARWRHCPNLSG